MHLRELLCRHQVWSKCFCCCLAVCRPSASLEHWFSSASSTAQKETSWEWAVRSTVPGDQCRNSPPCWMCQSLPLFRAFCLQESQLGLGRAQSLHRAVCQDGGLFLLQRAQHGHFSHQPPKADNQCPQSVVRSWRSHQRLPVDKPPWGEKVNASRFHLFAVLVSSHEAEQLPELLGLNHGQMRGSDPKELVTLSLGRYSHPRAGSTSTELCRGWFPAWCSEMFPPQANLSWLNVGEVQALPQCPVAGGASALLALVAVQVHRPQGCGGVSSLSLCPGDASQLQQPLDSPWV